MAQAIAEAQAPRIGRKPDSGATREGNLMRDRGRPW